MELNPAQIARAEALAEAEAGTDPTWAMKAKRALWEAIQHLDELTTDDVECAQSREPRAWGPIMLAAARAGLIVNTGLMRESCEAACHARPKTIWRVRRSAVAAAL